LAAEGRAQRRVVLLRNVELLLINLEGFVSSTGESTSSFLLLPRSRLLRAGRRVSEWFVSLPLLPLLSFPSPPLFSNLSLPQADPNFYFHFVLSAEGQYVDLSLNPERFTGYAGLSAARVWKSIYEENCFGLSELSVSDSSEGSSLSSSASSAQHLAPGAIIPESGSSGGLGGSVGGGQLSEGTEMRDGGDDECVEKRVYYRIVSGELKLGASFLLPLNKSTTRNEPDALPFFFCRFPFFIAPCSLRSSRLYLNTYLLRVPRSRDWTLGASLFLSSSPSLPPSFSSLLSFVPPLCCPLLPIHFHPRSQTPDLQCFIYRIASHPDRLQNMYFNLVLLLRAVSRAGPYLEAYDVSTGDLQLDAQTRTGLQKVVETAKGGEEGRGEVFDEGGMFKGEDALVSEKGV